MDKKQIAFKIGVPIDMPPPRNTEGRGRYFKVWAALVNTEAGNWLPIECENLLEMRRLQNNAVSRHFRTTRRDTTLYIYKEK